MKYATNTNMPPATEHQLYATELQYATEYQYIYI